VVAAHVPSTDAQLILDSGLFDPEWYAATAGCTSDPVEAVHHYLGGGWKKGHTAHPMFDHRHLMKRYAAVIGEGNPLIAYLTNKRMSTASTQPLMAYRTYQRTHPEASGYRRGVTRHYLEVGAHNAFAPSTWYRPDPTTEPQGLADWMRRRRREWVRRRDITTSTWASALPERQAAPPLGLDLGDASRPLVSVILPTGAPTENLAVALASVLRQTVDALEVLLVHPHDHVEEIEALLDHYPDARVRPVVVSSPERSAALAAGATAATGAWVAFCLPTVEWVDDHLEAIVAFAQREGVDAASDVVQRVDSDGTSRYCMGPVTLERSLVAPQVHAAGLVVRRDVLEDLGGLDASVHCALLHDLELRLVRRGDVPVLDRLGARTSAQLEAAASAAVPLRTRPRIDVEQLPTWHQVVLARHLVDWEALGEGEADLVSVIIPTHADFELTRRAVMRVFEARDAALDELGEKGRPGARTPTRVEVVVVDNGCPADEAVALDSLPLEFPGTLVVHEPVNRGFALANNLAMAATSGRTVVFLNNDTEVRQGWLEPLVAALEDQTVHGAQSLLVYPSGSIQSAGIAFPSTGGVPHPLLQGFPVEDAAGADKLPLQACTAASLAMRRTDIVALRGFDPLFLNGMEDVDLGLRMSRLREGRFCVRPDSVVLHHESRAPGRFERSLINRRIMLDRYGEEVPRDDVELWREVGYDVVGHEVRHVVTADRRLSVPEPVLVRTASTNVHEGVPALRWALKNPAPPGPEAERWGDTHFIRQLAAALRRLGQDVVVDHRPEFERATGRFDDVVLVLRGVAPYTPVYGQVSMCWLISHPEMMSRREAESYDRVFAASRTWAARMSSDWGVRIDSLLQATDPELFHPDRGRPDTGHSVLFVGSSRKVLRPLVGAAVESGLPLSIFGHQWEGLVPPRYIKAEYLGNELVGEAYRRAGVVLNDHWDDMREQGFISNRLFDAVSSGARVVTDDVAGMEGLFGRSVQVLSDPADLRALVNMADLDEVFGTDEERRDAARAVHREHSFDARARTLIEAAAELGVGPQRTAYARGHE
jgi:GT2 family glycosyltransferase